MFYTTRRLAPVTAVILCAGMLIAPVLANAADPGGAESPQALYERVQKAAEADNFGELVACIAPGDRAQMTMMMIVMTGFMVSMASMGVEMGEGMSEALSEDATEAEKAEAKAKAEKAKQEAAAMAGKFQEILEKHGVAHLMADDAEMPEPGPDEDPGVFAMNLFKDVDQCALINDLWGFLNSVSDDMPKESPVPVGALENLQIDGDTASATVDGEDFNMVRIDGRWFVRVPMD